MRIAITGGIGEGKSTVLRYLRELGYSVASADEIARTLFDEAETSAFLTKLLKVDSDITRSFVRDRLAENPSLRRELNAYMHPRIRQAIRDASATFTEVPLLIETCGQSDYDRVWVVTCTREEQLQRLASRYGSDAKICELVESQLPTETKIPFADLIIRTNRPEQSVREVVDRAAKEALATEFKR